MSEKDKTGTNSTKGDDDLVEAEGGGPPGHVPANEEIKGGKKAKVVHSQNAAENDLEATARSRHQARLKTRGKTLWEFVQENIEAIAGESYRLRSERTTEEAGEAHILMSEKEAHATEILDILRKSDYFETLPERTKKMVVDEQERRAGKIHALDILAMKERGEKVDDDYEDYTTTEKQDDKIDEEYRLRHLWYKRSKRLNWTIWITFHTIIIINFFICLAESYRIILEHAKFERLYLNDEFNCLERVLSGDSVNHFFNIIHATTCIAVLFTEELKTANLCWAYIIAQMGHACCDTFQFLYSVRFPSEDKTVDSPESILFFAGYLIFLVFSTLIVIQRYYDMTNILQKRTTRFTSSLYSGRLLNENIIFKNETSFLQKKYTLRQAQALMIYGIVQKIQHFKQRGIEPDPADIENDVVEARDYLQDLKGYTGSDLVRHLRRRNAQRIKKLEEVDSLDEIGVNAQGKHGKKGKRRRKRKSKDKNSPSNVEVSAAPATAATTEVELK